jgi:hypothetical protein
MERPDGIIITISLAYLKERGYRTWLKDFMKAMETEDYTYWIRLAQLPKFPDLLYVYLLINGKIKYRTNLVGFYPNGTINCDDGRILTAKVWCCVSGPLIKPRYPIFKKGFQGFRYTETLF